MALGPSLFRQEALEFQRGQREFGDIALLQPVSTKLLVWLLAGVVTIAIVFLCSAQFSRKQTVAGFLTPAAGTMKIFPNAEGVVNGIYVKEGQQVNKGDPLFAVATAQVTADGEDVNAAKLAALKQQQESLGHQIAAEQQSATSERERLKTVIAASQSAIGDLRGQIDLQNQRVQLAEGLVNAAQDAWTEQVVKRGWTTDAIPNALHPAANAAWLAIVLLALGFLAADAAAASGHGEPVASQ